MGHLAIEALIDVIEDRENEMELREQALFWFAQSGSDTALEYFDRLLNAP